MPKNIGEAIKWYRKSVAQGYAGAYCGLGDLYESDDCVARDYVQAYKWFNLATASVSAPELRDHAVTRCKQLAPKIAEEIAEAGRLANAWNQSHLIFNQ